MAERGHEGDTRYFSPVRRVNKGEVIAANEVCAKVKDLYGKAEMRCRSAPLKRVARMASSYQNLI
jgi:hypothetical protein